MTPKEIITKHVMSINGIRIPFAKIVVERIFTELNEWGYTIIEKGALSDALFKQRGHSSGQDSGGSKGF